MSQLQIHRQVEVYSPNERNIRVQGFPNPFSTKRIDMLVEPGMTIAEILARAQPDPVLRERAVVFIGDQLISRKHWHRVRPKPFTQLRIRTLAAGGGGGKNPLRTVLMIAVMVAAMAAGQAWAASLAFNVVGGTVITTTQLAIAKYAIIATIGVVGSLIVNAIAPPPKPKLPSLSGSSGQDSPTLFINGARNQANPFGKVPRVLGRHRMAPPYGAKSYTEIQGKDQYVRMLFVWGYAPLKLEDLKIGETLLTAFEDYEIEHRGLMGKSASFPGTTGQAFALPALDFGTTFTVEGYVKTSAVSEGTIVSNASATAGLSVIVTPDGKLRLKQYKAGPDSDYVDSTGTVNDGDPHTFSIVVEDDTVSFYIDELLDSTAAFPVAIASASGTAYVGAEVDANRFVGELDDVRVWSVARPAARVNEPINYDATGLVAWFGFDDEDARDYADGASHTATGGGTGVTYPTGMTFTQHPLTLFPDDVNEDVPSVTLTAEADWQQRTTLRDTEEISLDFTYPQGLVQYDSEGNKTNRSVTVEIQYKSVDSVDWIDVESLTTTGKVQAAVRDNRRWTVAKGQYDVRVRRATADSTSNQIVDTTVWSALRSISLRDPVRLPGLCKTALRIRASDQLNGTIDQLNAIATSILKDYDSATGKWILQETQNPASLYREVYQGRANKRRIVNARLDIDKMEEWHSFNVTNGYKFNHVVDYKTTVTELLDLIASSGRAARSTRDNLHSIIIDKPHTIPAQHFTPRNTWGFSAERGFPELPHGWRTRFVNENNGFQQDERIVYDDGYDESTATIFEGLELTGITDPDLIWKFGRYHIASARLRPEVFTFNTDAEHLACTRGDMVMFSHDVPMVGLARARVKSAVLDDNGDVEALVLDEYVTMELMKSYTVRFRKSDGSSTVRAVQTVTGDTNVVTFQSAMPVATAPEAGDLVLFGELGEESMELLVKDIEPGQDMSARLTCIPYAPEIYDADTGVIPEYDTGISVPRSLDTPSADDIRSDGSVLVRDPDGSWSSRILIELYQPSDIEARINRVETQYRVSDSAGEWLTLPLSGPRPSSVSIFTVEDGETYDIRMRYVTLNDERGEWSETYTHTVEGKTAAPDIVTGFRASQNGSTINFRWVRLPDRDIRSYQIKYMSVDSPFIWADAKLLTEVGGSTSITSADIPPGNWIVGIKAVDTSENESATAATTSIDITNSNDVVWNEPEAPDWTGTLDGFVLHHTGVLIPQALGVAADEDWETFDSFVANPVETCTYTSAEIDIGYVELVRVWSNTTFFLHPEGSVNPDVGLEIRYAGANQDGDMWNADGDTLMWSADGSTTMWDSWSEWTPWSIGTVNAQYVQHRMVLTPETDGVPVITDFTPVVDVLPRSEGARGVVVAIGGTPITFNKRFPETPRINVTAIGSTAALAMADEESVTGFTAYVFDTNGNDVGGTINWDASTE